MGLLGFIGRIIETAVPYALESHSGADQNTDNAVNLDDVDDLVEQCESLLDCIKKHR